MEPDIFLQNLDQLDLKGEWYALISSDELKNNFR